MAEASATQAALPQADTADCGTACVPHSAETTSSSKSPWVELEEQFYRGPMTTMWNPPLSILEENVNRADLYYYSPAICPLGWYPAYPAFPFLNRTEGVTSTLCCPFSYLPVTAGGRCGTEAYCLSLHTLRSVDTDGVTYVKDACAYERPVQVRWAESDLAALETDPLLNTVWSWTVSHSLLPLESVVTVTEEEESPTISGGWTGFPRRVAYHPRHLGQPSINSLNGRDAIPTLSPGSPIRVPEVAYTEYALPSPEGQHVASIILCLIPVMVGLVVSATGFMCMATRARDARKRSNHRHNSHRDPAYTPRITTWPSLVFLASILIAAIGLIRVAQDVLRLDDRGVSDLVTGIRRLRRREVDFRPSPVRWWGPRKEWGPFLSSDLRSLNLPDPPVVGVQVRPTEVYASVETSPVDQRAYFDELVGDGGDGWHLACPGDIPDRFVMRTVWLRIPDYVYLSVVHIDHANDGVMRFDLVLELEEGKDWNRVPSGPGRAGRASLIYDVRLQENVDGFLVLYEEDPDLDDEKRRESISFDGDIVAPGVANGGENDSGEKSHATGGIQGAGSGGQGVGELVVASGGSRARLVAVGNPGTGRLISGGGRLVAVESVGGKLIPVGGGTGVRGDGGNVDGAGVAGSAENNDAGGAGEASGVAGGLAPTNGAGGGERKSSPSGPRPGRPAAGDAESGETSSSLYILNIFTEADYFFAYFFPNLLTVLFTVPWRIVHHQVASMEPFFQLAGEQGTTISHLSRLRYRLLSGLLPPVLPIINRDWAIVWAATLEYICAIMAPVAAETVGMGVMGPCDDFDAANCLIVVEVLPKVAVIAQCLLGAMVLAIIALLYTLSGRTSALRNDPRSIIGITALLRNEETRRKLKSIPEKDLQSIKAICEQLGQERFKTGSFLPPLGLSEYGIIPVNSPSARGPSPARPEPDPDVQGPTISRTDTGSTDASEDADGSDVLKPLDVRWSCWTLLGFAALHLGLVAMILYWRLTSRGDSYAENTTAFSKFMMSQRFGVRFLFAALGVAINFCWMAVFDDALVLIPIWNLSQGYRNAESTILRHYTTDPYSELVRSLRARRFFTSFLSFVVVLSDFLPMLLTNVPYSRLLTNMANWINVGLSMAILSLMATALVALAFLMWRYRPKFFIPLDVLRKNPLLGIMMLACSSETTAAAVGGLSIMTTGEQAAAVKKVGAYYKLVGAAERGQRARIEMIDGGAAAVEEKPEGEREGATSQPTSDASREDRL